MAVADASPSRTVLTVRIDVRVLLTAGAFLAAAAAIVLPIPVTTGARVLQHFLSIGIQIAASGLAAILAWRAGAPYWVGSREGLVWRRTSLAACLWATALVVQAVSDWAGRGPAFPSVADVLFLASAVVLTVTLGIEFGRARWLFSRRHRLIFYATTVVLWAVVMGVLFWPAMMVPPRSLGEAVTFLYATTAILLFALAVHRAVTSRVGLIGSGWIGMAAGAGLLAIAMLGTIRLTWLEMYSPSHPINLVRIAAFCLLGGSAAWHRDAWRARIFGVQERRTRSTRPRVWSAIWARMRNGGLQAIRPSEQASRRLSPAPNGPATIIERYRIAEQLLATGRLSDAQEEYLNILLLYKTDDDSEAMRGLITARRRLALDDPLILHRQATAYQRAITSGLETEERYTGQALQLLAKASLLAAQELEAKRHAQA
ncbi:MAG: hypothetical protein ACRDGN_05955 [bacterium]